MTVTLMTVTLAISGKDADEMYEDIGHSNEARKTMKKYLIGNFEVQFETSYVLYVKWNSCNDYYYE